MIYIVRHGQTNWNLEGIYARCYFEGEPINQDYGRYKINNCEVNKYDIN